jgi:Flp pilus assembly protein TadB
MRFESSDSLQPVGGKKIELSTRRGWVYYYLALVVLFVALAVWVARTHSWAAAVGGVIAWFGCEVWRRRENRRRARIRRQLGLPAAN